MSEFEDRLNSILNDPDRMEQITSMAKSLMGTDEQAPNPPKTHAGKESGIFETLDPGMLGRLAKVMGGGTQSDEKQALLEAMKPFLSTKRREKMERAMHLAKMIHVAEIAFGTLGGDHAEI